MRQPLLQRAKLQKEKLQPNQCRRNRKVPLLRPVLKKPQVPAVNLAANSPWGGRRSVVKTMARREMSTQAKEWFRDADAAQKFFTQFKKETDDIPWFPRPPGPQCCKNFEDCNSSEAMFWCHPCGFAYCLECRTHGLACHHNIVNYSSELSTEFLPDTR